MTKLPQEDRRSRAGSSGLPRCASDFTGKSMFSQHRPGTWDDVRLARFVDHCPMGLAPTVEPVPDRVQQLLAEQCNLHYHTDELGLPYWYHGDQPGLNHKHYCAVTSTVSQQFVIPQTFGRRCIQPRCTVDYQHAYPKEVSIYIRPLFIVDSGAAGTVLPVPQVNDRSFEEDRLAHWTSGQNEGRSDVASLAHGGSVPRSYSIGGHIILPHLKYYPEGTTGFSPLGRTLSTGSQSSVARVSSGFSRPSAKRPAPTPTPSASSSSGAANTGISAAPESKRMPQAKPSRGRLRPSPRTLAVPESSSDGDQN